MLFIVPVRIETRLMSKLLLTARYTLSTSILNTLVILVESISLVSSASYITNVQSLIHCYNALQPASNILSFLPRTLIIFQIYRIFSLFFSSTAASSLVDKQALNVLIYNISYIFNSKNSNSLVYSSIDYIDLSRAFFSIFRKQICNSTFFYKNASLNLYKTVIQSFSLASSNKSLDSSLRMFINVALITLSLTSSVGYSCTLLDLASCLYFNKSLDSSFYISTSLLTYSLSSLSSSSYSYTFLASTFLLHTLTYSRTSSCALSSMYSRQPLELARGMHLDSLLSCYSKSAIFITLDSFFYTTFSSLPSLDSAVSATLPSAASNKSLSLLAGSKYAKRLQLSSRYYQQSSSNTPQH